VYDGNRRRLMEKIDILLWIIGGGFALMLVMWNNIHHSISWSEIRMTKIIDEQGRKIDEINTKISEIDKRLYGIETVLHMKDCCMLKQDQNLKKVE